MPVTAPRWLGPTIKGGVALGSTLLAGRRSPAEKAAVAPLQQGITAGQNITSALAPVGTSLLTRGAEAMNPSLDYWKGILSGDRGAVTSAMAPELNRIAEGYEAARTSQSNLTPRGGGRSALLSQLPYQQQRDVQTTLQQARPEAAKNLVGAGTAIANTGSAAINSAIAALHATTAAGQTLLENARYNKYLDTEQGRGIGASILDIASGVAPDFFGGGEKAAKIILPTLGAGAISAGAAPISALGGGAASLIPSVGSTIPAVGLAGAGGAAGGAGTAATSVTPAAAGSSLTSTLGALATNPATWVVAGAVVGGLIWRKSQAHWEANDWVQHFQNPFDQSMAQIDAAIRSGQLQPEQAQKSRQDLIQGYQAAMAEFAKKGNDQNRVIQQAQRTLQQQYGAYLPRAA